MGEIVHAVSNNIRIVFGIFLNFHTTRNQANHRFRIRQQRPASVNRSGMEKPPGGEPGGLSVSPLQPPGIRGQPLPVALPM
jgi:hypothetical protein